MVVADNAQGSYRTTKQAAMAAFDKLPPAVREALANANENWVAQPILTMVRRTEKYMWTSEAHKLVVGRIKQWNKQEAGEHWYRMERLYATGVDYFTPIRRDAVKRKMVKN